ncbi:hypothetical protein ACEWMW_06410 [Altererythrobacter sp. MF3-039]
MIIDHSSIEKFLQPEFPVGWQMRIIDDAPNKLIYLGWPVENITELVESIMYFDDNLMGHIQVLETEFFRGTQG